MISLEREIICKNPLAHDHYVPRGSHWYKNLKKFGVKWGGGMKKWITEYPPPLMILKLKKINMFDSHR